MADPDREHPLSECSVTEVTGLKSEGTITSAGSVEPPREGPGPFFSLEEHRAKATKLLALLLFGALIAAFAAHIVLVMVLAHNHADSVEQITRVFSTWVPVLAGLFGSAATFYFTQGK